MKSEMQDKIYMIVRMIIKRNFSYPANLVNPVPDGKLSLVGIIWQVSADGDVAAAEAELAEFVL